MNLHCSVALCWHVWMGRRERYACLQELAWWWKMAITTAPGPDSVPVLFAASRIRWQSRFFSRLQCSPCARQLLQQMAGPPGRSLQKIPSLSSLLRVGASLSLPSLFPGFAVDLRWQRILLRAWRSNCSISLPFQPQLSPLTLFSQLNSLQDRLFGSCPLNSWSS